MSECLSLRIKTDFEEIERITQEVAIWCRKMALPEEIEYEIDLVLDELVSNVIRHGLKENTEHFIAVGLRRDVHDLILEVEDDGVPFNPLNAPTPDTSKPLEERCIGGLGIHLVRLIMDSLSYEWREGRNHLVAKKRLGDSP